MDGEESDEVRSCDEIITLDEMMLVKVVTGSI